MPSSAGLGPGRSSSDFLPPPCRCSSARWRASVFGYALIPAIVVGSLLASHTLLSVPIVQRLGVIRVEPIVVTIGATVLSDTLSLVVFAVCVSMYTTGFSPERLANQLTEIAIFVPLILIGLSRAGAWALSRMGSDEEAHFPLMLVQ